MINKCYAVTEAIALLQKQRKPDDVIIFAYLCAEDIQNSFTEDAINASKEAANQIMYALGESCAFGIANEHECIPTLHAYLTQIEEKIAVILNKQGVDHANHYDCQ